MDRGRRLSPMSLEKKGKGEEGIAKSSTSYALPNSRRLDPELRARSLINGENYLQEKSRSRRLG